MKYYCHFTSPIRRYPDLQIHRIIKENLHGGMKEKRIEHYQKILPEVTEQTSALERRADDAEREVEKMKKAEYMEQFVGKDFEGTISGLTTWGMYVELPNTIEGMIRVADIPGDYYYYDEDLHRMVGENTGKVYKMGEPLRIIVAGVDKLTRTIDFVLYQEDEEGNPILPPMEKKSPKERISAREDGKGGRTRSDRGSRRMKDRKAKKKAVKRRSRK